MELKSCFRIWQGHKQLEQPLPPRNHQVQLIYCQGKGTFPEGSSSDKETLRPLVFISFFLQGMEVQEMLIQGMAVICAQSFAVCGQTTKTHKMN